MFNKNQLYLFDLMKKIIYPFLIALFTACGNSTPQTDLGQLIEKRDELRKQYDELGKEIAEIEQEIALLDTTKRKTLVTVLPAAVDTFRHYFEVYGSVDVKRNALLVAESPGNVKSIRVKDGDRVSAGQVILELDDDLLQKNLAEINTNYDLAKSLFERQDRLWKENIGSEVQYLEAKNRMESLENSRATLQEQLNKTTIRAPFSGVVDEVMIKVGEMAGVGVPVARILDLSEFHIEAEVPENYSANLSEGSEVEVIIAGSDTLKASISNVGSFINPANRTFRILVDVDAETGRFKPNQLTILRINDQTVPQAVVLPGTVIQQDAQGKDFVFVAEKTNGRYADVKKVTIQTGRSYQNQTHVISGLKGSELVVDRGSRSIRDGQEIEIKER